MEPVLVTPSFKLGVGRGARGLAHPDTTYQLRNTHLRF